MIPRKAEKLSTYDATQDWHYLLAGLVETQKRMRRNCLPHELVHSYFGTRVKHGDAPELATDDLDQTPFRQSLRVFKTLYKINYPLASGKYFCCSRMWRSIVIKLLILSDSDC